ncbi:MAG: OsmC family protein, partial [Candidatus Thorarchaeota archaeon]
MNERQAEHRVEVKWTGDKSGKVIVEGRNEIWTGLRLGSEENVQDYTPEELFVAAGAVCFMNSFVYFTKKMRIEFKAFEAESAGYLELVDRSYEITKIHTKTRLVIDSEDLRNKFERALELGAKYC